MTTERIDVLAAYRVRYSRKSDDAEFSRDFRTHAAAKRFAMKKKHEPGWSASWPVKLDAAIARVGGSHE